MLIITGRFINPSTAALTSLIAVIIGVKSIDGPCIVCAGCCICCDPCSDCCPCTACDPCNDCCSPPKLVPAITVSLSFTLIAPSGANNVRLP